MGGPQRGMARAGRVVLDQGDQAVVEPVLVLVQPVGEVGVAGRLDGELHRDQEPALVLVLTGRHVGHQPGGQVTVRGRLLGGRPQAREEPVGLGVVEDEEELLLRLVVGVEGVAGESGAGLDVVDGGCVEAAFREERQRALVERRDGDRAALGRRLRHVRLSFGRRGPAAGGGAVRRQAGPSAGGGVVIVEAADVATAGAASVRPPGTPRWPVGGVLMPLPEPTHDQCVPLGSGACD